MSLTLRAGGLRAGLPEGEYGIGATAVGSNSNTRGRCRFPTASFGSRSSASAPPRLLRGSSVDPSKRHRRVLSESPRPNARRPCSAAHAFGKPSTFYGHGAPAGSRRSNSCCKGKAAVAQHASSGRTGMLQNPALYGGSAAFLGRAATKGGSSVSLAVNSLLSPAFVSTAEETGLIAARHNGDVQTQAPASSLDLAADEERPTLNVQRIKQEAYTGTVRVRLTVQHPSAAEGVQLKAVGNRRALGSWNPGMAADFENRGDGSWSLDVTVPPGLLRFKLVLQSADGLVLAEKGIRRTEVPSARLAQSMPACYFNISCAWGVAGDPTLQAIRLPETARQHQIRSAEEQVARLRERQAKLQARMTDLSSQIKRTNNQISTIHQGVQSTAAQEVAARRGNPSTSARSSHAAAPQTQQKRPGHVLGFLSKLRLSRPNPAAPTPWVPPQDIDSLFDHPSWSGTPKARPSVAAVVTDQFAAVSEEAAVQETVEPTEPEAKAPLATETVEFAVELPPALEDTQQKEDEEVVVEAEERKLVVTRVDVSESMFRSVDCPAILMTAGAMWSARAAASVWHSVRTAIPKHHRQTADVCGAVAAAAVFMTLMT